MATAVITEAPRGSARFYRRMEVKIGVAPLRSDADLARLVETGLPVTVVDALVKNGFSEDEVSACILPRRVLTQRKAHREPLTQDESDRAVRLARTAALAEEVFGDAAKAALWLRKPKARFSARTPLEMLRTEAGARLVEEMLLQIDYGFAA